LTAGTAFRRLRRVHHDRRLILNVFDMVLKPGA
jgi:hypothetical protein